MTKDEALKYALAAMEEYAAGNRTEFFGPMAAIREALTEQPAQTEYITGIDGPPLEQPAQQQQEPVAWMNPDDLCADTAFRWCEIDEFTVPLYTSPPQRKPWVGLTDDEFQFIYAKETTPAGMMEMVEAKLKEKNEY